MSLKDIKSAERCAAQQKEVLLDLGKLVEDIERCEKTVIDLQAELSAVTSKYQGHRTTRDDIEYLTLLLKCANKKLAWEKHMTSVQKRTPLLLQKMSSLLNDEKNPPEEQMKAAMLKALQGLQSAMERLQAVKVS